MSKRGLIKEVVAVCHKLGWTAFGGPAAHIAMLEEETVEKRKWMSRQHFLDLMGLTNLIPGPNSTEMVMHAGLHRAGLWGWILGGLAFLLPAVGMTMGLAYLYIHYGSLPEVAPVLKGMQAAVLILIFRALLRLGKKALKSTELWMLGFWVCAINLLGVPAIYCMAAGGIVGALLILGNQKGLYSVAPFLLSIPDTETLPSLVPVFTVFLIVGSTLFGSGYLLLSYLEERLVQDLAWLSREELLDALVAGQMTPGPVLTTATFIGYYLGGWKLALAATLGIFLPAFLLVRLIQPLAHKVRKNKTLSMILDAVNVSALALIVALCIRLLEPLTVEPIWLLIPAVILAMDFSGFKLSAIKVLILGAGSGWVLHQIGF